LILSELVGGVFVQNQVVFTKFDIYVFITVTVDISAGELLVSEGIIRHVVSGSTPPTSSLKIKRLTNPKNIEVFECKETECFK
jgi:hypothetical protein